MGPGRIATTAVAGVAGLVGLGIVGARRNVRQIQENRDPYPLDVLRRDPQGETVWLDRPDGTRIRTIVAGEGPTVLLSHGYGVTLKEWNVVQSMLVDRGRRVICFDWRGHGQTTIGTEGITPEAIAGDYLAVLEHFDVTDGVLVGHSTGGYLSIATLLTRPGAAERLAGLVLFASLAGDAIRDAPQNKLQIPLITSGVMERAVRNDLVGYPFAASIWGPDPSPAACRVFLDEFAAQDHQQLVPLLERLATTSYYDRLHDIGVPTVVICGEEDETTPRWHSETLGREIPGARNVWVPAAGHMLNWQAPEVLVEVVEELLSGTA